MAKRKEGIVRIEQDSAIGRVPYGRPTTGKKAGKRPASTQSQYKASTGIVHIKVGPRNVKVRMPKVGHHIDTKKSPVYWECNGKRVPAPFGKKVRRGEK